MSKKIVYDKETLERGGELYDDARRRSETLQRVTLIPYADGSLVGVRGADLETIAAAAQALAKTPADIAALIEEVERLADILHRDHRHPDYEYECTDGPRKAWDGAPDLSPEGWHCQSWEHYDYHEVRTWRRRKTNAEHS